MRNTQSMPFDFSNLESGKREAGETVRVGGRRRDETGDGMRRRKGAKRAADRVLDITPPDSSFLIDFTAPATDCNRCMKPLSRPSSTRPHTLLSFTHTSISLSTRESVAQHLVFLTQRLVMPVVRRTVQSMEDRLALLQALREHGYHRVIEKRGEILNHYFEEPKSDLEVKWLLRYYDQKATQLSPYQTRRGKRAADPSPGRRLESQALSKWHHVVPPPVTCMDQAFGDAIAKIGSAGFPRAEQQVLKFLSSLLDNERESESVSAEEALILLRLTSDLETEALSATQSSASLLHHMSQSFWNLIQDKERSVTVTLDGEDALVASFDPYKLAERLQLLEPIVTVSMEINQQMTERSHRLTQQEARQQK